MAYEYNQGNAPGPPPYMMLSENNAGNSGMGGLQPPPYRRNIPRYHSGHHNSSSSSTCSCCCLCCCCCSFFLIIIAILAGIAIYLYLVLDPKIPSYKITNFDVQSFHINANDLSLQTKFIINIRAENPNRKIGIAYQKGSKVILKYHDVKISSGNLQTFYQGYHNVTMIKVEMEGKEKLSTGIGRELSEDKEKGRIPLSVHVRVPVVLKMLDLKLRQVTVNVDSDLVVGDLSPGKKAAIKSSEYKINFLEMVVGETTARVLQRFPVLPLGQLGQRSMHA
ncbi:hypothetical protein J5N97_006559 [Dioscorea zingiberensis]|uniref:Late embryogenesis abundant protein LEA-2 subgroup domain-containing protein n=1 Tax=Dioscorea zingiberensis TaxID=325984 RepID=A0A9D5HTP3_9LILI|nr:hypothetical protein J5N97_006559 [Dioscorea zingiberensis]